jgi:hypothetical protein
MAFSNVYYTVLLLNDSLLFVRTGEELSGPNISPIEQDALRRYSLMSRDEILTLHKKNFYVPYNELISLNLKKSSFSLGGPRSGIFTVNVTGKKTANFNIALFQDINIIKDLVQSIIPNKLMSINSIGTATSLYASMDKIQHPNSEISIIKTAENQNDGLSRNERIVRNGSNWLFFIAAFSLINYFVYLFDGNINFIIGLGITQIFAYSTKASGQTLNMLAIIITSILGAIFAVCGIFSRKGKVWAFVVGIIVYAPDTLLFLIVYDWLSIIFHGIALYFLIQGVRASLKMKKTYEGNLPN